MDPNSQMNMIGWTIGILNFLLLIPLLPFVLVYVVVDRLVGLGQRETADRDPTRAPRS